MGEIVADREQAWAVPESWRVHMHPRRGTGPVPEVAVDPVRVASARKRIEELAGDLAVVLAPARCEPRLAAAAQAYLRGEPDALGAAAVAEIAAHRGASWREADGLVAFADLWAEQHGLAFAARATSELTDLRCWTTSMEPEGCSLQVREGETFEWSWEGQGIAIRVRALLAAATEPEYLAAVEALAGLQGSERRRLCAVYLAPTRRDWVDRLCAELSAGAELVAAELLLCAVDSVDQLSLLTGHEHVLPRGLAESDVLRTAVEAVGPPIAPFLGRVLDGDLEAYRREFVLGVLGLLPTDEAFEALLARLGQKFVGDALLAVMERYPVRALRLLTKAAAERPGSSLVAVLARMQALTTPGLAAELPAELRAVVEEVQRGRVGDAPEAALPPELVSPQWTKAPKVGGWADPVVLPQVLLRDRRHALSAAAARNLISMLALSSPDAEYPGLEPVRQACDPDSLAEFAWSLFQRWRIADSPVRDGWALTALGRLGDDETVRRLAPVVRAWPGEGGHARAVTGLTVLAMIGTDVALAHLHSISQRVKFKALRERAVEKIAAVAEGLGLSPDELADRLVPDLGLDQHGTLILDYGPRTFTVGFDEQLKPFVLDADGKPRKDLPKPGARDDAELAPLAYKRFGALKKDVRAIAADQIVRLERAMTSQRRWRAEEFHSLLAGHPLLWHLVRRLVWLAERDGQVLGTFRLAEDRTLADAADDPFTLPEGVKIGIAHPLAIPGQLARWAEVFADYEIVQPFPQLGRPVHTLTDEERGGDVLARFHGVVAPVGKVLGLQRRGWVRAAAQDNGWEPWISRPVPGGAVVMNLDPGITVGMIDMDPEHRIEAVWLGDEPDWSYPKGKSARTFAELDPVTASELLAELTELTT
ncbi:DUF4132 domain-containing protein [Crossiella sp. CA-258035]|uniref:DUF4132 domain-containing protein n=1 Tax=Crossiella sp. CA-258035 TaxID=2981138 RepID=UPI0024BBF064|nr:DUF4132 domain-containing protein [Crossiella sp. CA-258035]WHT23410.1 DUF4132 domain-containing protein [Crossiella sp. CA-258035]